MPKCVFCGEVMDDAKYTFFGYGRWVKKLTEIEAMLKQNTTLETVITIMLRILTNWKALEGHVTLILGTKKEDERLRR